MARAKVSRNFKFVSLSVLEGAEAEMRAAGVQLSVDLENRALSGRDENGRAFAPYAAGTVRDKHGDRTVTLHRTSRMFGDFGVLQVTARGFGLGFKTDESLQ